VYHSPPLSKKNVFEVKGTRGSWSVFRGGHTKPLSTHARQANAVAAAKRAAKRDRAEFLLRWSDGRVLQHSSYGLKERNDAEPRLSEAAAEAVNADGGIDGRPITVVTCNIQDENGAAGCGCQAVEEGVIATVGTFSTFSTFATQYLAVLEEAGIPQVAPYMIDFADYTSPINFPVMGGSLTITAGIGAQLSDDDAKSISVAYLDVEQGALAADLLAIGSDPRGAETVSETPVLVGRVATRKRRGFRVHSDLRPLPIRSGRAPTLNESSISLRRIRLSMLGGPAGTRGSSAGGLACARVGRR
jgi:Periplasmic binding protein/Uncharacterized protein conserved in bacteria (DUF2188)